MAYLLILRRNQDDELGLPPEEMLRRFVEWTQALQSSGFLRGVERLKPAMKTVTLRRRDGELVLEGRYPAVEDVIGYYLLDVDKLESARRFAEECPILAVGGSVEIRETEPFRAQ